MATERKVYTNNVVRMTQAEFDRMCGQNGFTKDRTMRKVGSVPVDVYADLHALASANGDEITNQQWTDFLNMNPQYRTVDKLDTGRSGHIIIK